MRLAVCIPTHGPVPVDFALSLAGLVADLAACKEVDDCFLVAEDNHQLQARQSVVDKALDSGADFLLMIDSDMVFPSDIFRRLYAHKLPIVACDYYRRKEGAGKVAVDFDDNPLPDDATGLLYAKGTGLGMALISAEVFSRLGRPWFDTFWRKDKDGTLKVASCDGVLFERARHEGFELMIDADASRLIGHVGSKVYKEG